MEQGTFHNAHVSLADSIRSTSRALEQFSLNDLYTVP